MEMTSDLSFVCVILFIWWDGDSCGMGIGGSICNIVHILRICKR